MNIIPMNQINNVSTFHFLPLAEDHLTRTDEQICCQKANPVIQQSPPAHQGGTELTSASY